MLIILLLSCFANIVADIFLLHGVRHTGWQPGLDALEKTPPRFILGGSLAGFVTITPWFLLLLPLSAIPDTPGMIGLVSYAIFIAAMMVFHISYAFVGLAIQSDPDLKIPFSKIIGAIAGVSALSGFIFSVPIVWLGLNGNLNMNALHYISLPTVSILLFQLILGTALKRLPYYLAISGNLAMALFFYGFFDLMALNPHVFT